VLACQSLDVLFGRARAAPRRVGFSGIKRQHASGRVFHRLGYVRARHPRATGQLNTMSIALREGDSETWQRQPANLCRPRFTCHYRIRVSNHPGGYDFTGREGRSAWLVGQYLDEVGQGDQRTAEHIPTDPVIDLEATRRKTTSTSTSRATGSGI
jgi:hypothetical protein